jgi:hypothetical protein
MALGRTWWLVDNLSTCGDVDRLSTYGVDGPDAVVVGLDL